MKRGRRSWMGIIFAVVMAGVLVIGMAFAAVPQIWSGDQNQSDITQPRNTPNTSSEEGSQEEEMRERIEEDPDDVGAMIVLADILTSSGRTQEAINLYKRALEDRPEQANLRSAFATALLRSGYQFDAEVQLKQAHALEPEDPEYLYKLAQLYEQMGPEHADDAEEYYSQVIELNPDSVYAERAQEYLETDEAE